MQARKVLENALDPGNPWSKVKVKVHTLDIAPLRGESPPQKRSGTAHVLCILSSTGESGKK